MQKMIAEIEFDEPMDPDDMANYLFCELNENGLGCASVICYEESEYDKE